MRLFFRSGFRQARRARRQRQRGGEGDIVVFDLRSPVERGDRSRRAERHQGRAQRRDPHPGRDGDQSGDPIRIGGDAIDPRARGLEIDSVVVLSLDVPEADVAQIHNISAAFEQNGGRRLAVVASLVQRHESDAGLGRTG